MALKLYAVKCPECNASLPIEEGRTQLFCSYCGAEVIVHNENEYIHRYIDEAELTQAETDRLVELKRLEMEEKQREQDESRRKGKMAISIVLGAVGLICLGAGYGGGGFGLTMVGISCMGILMLMWVGNKNDD